MRDLIIDCFAGGGGASVGMEMALGRPVDIAINHDPDAILMHKTNHPDTLHLTEDIFRVDLKKYVKDRHVALMWASPDCTSHSKAKGGKPRERGLRILPWAVYKHARAILPDVILMENDGWIPVEERLPQEKINPVSQDFYEYQVTARFEDILDVRHYKYGRGHWWNGPGIVDQYVVAWRENPAPYKPTKRRRR